MAAENQVYVRGGFAEKGRHSFIEAPNQEQAGFEVLENVLPPDTGPFYKRFGYTQFHNTGAATRRMYEYQRDADGSRRLMLTSTAHVSAINEDGTDFLTNLFVPDGAATEHPRMVSSRDYAFYQDGASADRLKWDGQLQNFLTRSEEFDDADWTKVGTPSIPVVTADADTAPDGTSTADQVVFSATGGGQANSIRTTVSTPPLILNQTFTFSVWLRSASAVNINVTMQEVPFVSSATTVAAVTSTWQRFSVSKSPSSGTPTSMAVLVTQPENESSKTIFAWGAKLEYGSTASGSFDSYGVTTSAALANNELTNWGITAPATAISVGAPSGSGVTLQDGRKYFLVFRNSTTGHNSGLNPVSATTGPITDDEIPLTNIEVSTDPQADRKLVLATADGGDETKLFFLADIPNATTILTDNISEDTLLTRNTYLDIDAFGNERGLADNDRPPTLTQIIKHRGRIWGSGDTTDPQFIFFSKSIADLTTATGIIAGRYEEAWPSTNFFDISAGAETINALFSDGITLYVGTERHIRRVLGDGQVIQKPEILFNNVGVVNTDVWKIVFREGNPVGTMFLTPDKKVMFTDFNTYKDIGFEIQDLLITINEAAIQTAYAETYSKEGDDWYLLAVPTGANTEPDTLLLFDLKRQQWYVWKFSDKVLSLLSNVTASGDVQLLFAGDDNRIHKAASASTQDKEGQNPDVAASFASTIQTTWRHFEAPHVLKLLNKMKLFSSDATLAVTIDGASTRAEFTTPANVIISVVPVSGPFGDLEVYLAGKITKDRFYRFKFVSTADLSSTTAPVLSYYEVHFLPFHIF